MTILGIYLSYIMNCSRYKIELRVIDETYNALFMVWDTEGAIIFGKSAKKLKEADVSPWLELISQLFSFWFFDIC